MYITTVPLTNLEATIGCGEVRHKNKITNLAMSRIREASTDFAEEIFENAKAGNSTSALIVLDKIIEVGQTVYYREFVIGPVQLTLVASDPKFLEFRVMQPGEHNDQGAAVAPGYTHPIQTLKLEKECKELPTAGLDVFDMDLNEITQAFGEAARDIIARRKAGK